MVGKIRTIVKPNPCGSHCFDACTMYQYKNGEKVHLEGQIRGGIWRPLGVLVATWVSEKEIEHARHLQNCVQHMSAPED
jgi:hypothetical protein